MEPQNILISRGQEVSQEQAKELEKERLLRKKTSERSILEAKKSEKPIVSS
jgi:hypothetical protein